MLVNGKVVRLIITAVQSSIINQGFPVRRTQPSQSFPSIFSVPQSLALSRFRSSLGWKYQVLLQPQPSLLSVLSVMV